MVVKATEGPALSEQEVIAAAKERYQASQVTPGMELPRFSDEKRQRIDAENAVLEQEGSVAERARARLSTLDVRRAKAPVTQSDPSKK